LFLTRSLAPDVLQTETRQIQLDDRELVHSSSNLIYHGQIYRKWLGSPTTHGRLGRDRGLGRPSPIGHPDLQASGICRTIRSPRGMGK